MGDDVGAVGGGRGGEMVVVVPTVDYSEGRGTVSGKEEEEEGNAKG